MIHSLRARCLLWVCLLVPAAAAVQPPGPAMRWKLGPDLPLVRHLVIAASTYPTGSAKPEGGVIVFPNAGRDSLWIWRAVLIAPTTGDYRFFIAADDLGTLWVSEDATRARRRVAAFTEKWTDRNGWNRYPTQRSEPIHLEQGKRYAMEMAWANGGATGHASAGWQAPGMAAPAPLPLANPDGSPLLELYTPPPDDTDNDALPDEWERANGLKVELGNGEQGGFADPDGDGLTNQEEYLLGTDPHKKNGIPGYAAVEIWPNLTAVLATKTYPEELLSNMPGKPAVSSQALERLSAPGGFAGARLRCVLRTPRDGYYQICAEAAGFQVILLSDDATPERLRLLWRDGALSEDHGPGFKDHRLRLESPWVYFKQGEPRYLEIRHLHTPGPAFFNLAWTGQDGVRSKIPAACVTSYIEPESAAPLPAADGKNAALLVGNPVAELRLDLRTARALTTGWSEFGPASSGFIFGTSSITRKLPDSGLCTTFGGSLEIPFTTATAGYHSLVMDGQICRGGTRYVHFEIWREIDGICFGRELLAAKDSEVTPFRCLTPWLTKGTHTLRLHCVPDRNMESLRILNLALRPLTSDAAQSAARASLARENAFLPGRGDGGSLISPACVEMSSRVSAAPVLKAGGRPLAVREATPGVWWADVPLPDSGAPLALTCESPADRTESAATARWTETHVLELREIYLRTGDALRLSAWRDDGGDGASATVSARGKDTPTPAGKPLLLRFDQPGDETVTAVFAPKSGEPVHSNMIVHVLPRLASTLDTEWTRTDRISPLKSLPAGAWPDGGTGATFRSAPDGGWLAAPRMAGEWPAVARAGAAGPVLGSIKVRAIDLTYHLHTYLDKDEPGSRGFNTLASDYAIVRGLPPGWKISYQQTAYYNRPWEFLRVDKAKPLHQEVYPWRYGACAVGEFWFKRTAEPQTWLAGDFDIVPPAKAE